MKFNSALERVHKSRKKVSKFLYEMWVSRPGELNAIGVKKPIFLSLDFVVMGSVHITLSREHLLDISMALQWLFRLTCTHLP